MPTSERRAMRVVGSPGVMRRLSAGWRRRGLSVGFVPTMGALHPGHLSLVERARAENDRVVVSVFVNPTQFGPNEDFSRYPRPFRRDARLCRQAGADALFHPAPGAMYPPGFSTFVEVPGLSDPLCGRSRPGHFRGVATVVLKLLNQVSADRLYLGEKDFQQLTVLRRMVRDLDVPVAVRGCRTFREADGLAMSSRNAYLTPGQRALAPRLRAALGLCAAAAARRGATPASVLAAGRRALRSIPEARLEYLELVDSQTLRPVRRLAGGMRLLTALRLGRTRLIDNIPIKL